MSITNLSNDHRSESNSGLSLPMLQEIEANYGTPLFILDVNAFKSNYLEFLSNFNAIYQNTNIAYSYKTNYIPLLCQEVNHLGGYAEVVSYMEYELALRVGVDPTRIVFNGPYKTKEELEHALLMGSIVNLDSEVELEVVTQIARDNSEKTIITGIRCNLSDSHASRFGFNIFDGSIPHIVSTLSRYQNCVIGGLHCHMSGGARTVESYALRARTLIELSAKNLPTSSLRFVNVGGGYFGKMPPCLSEQFLCTVPSYRDYACAIASQMAIAYPQEGGPELIVEPGTALVSDIMQFIAKVITVRRIGERDIAVVSGSIHNIKPTLHRKQLPMTVVSHDDGTRRPADRRTVDIVGYTCMEHDCLYRGWSGPLAVGDYVVFGNVGAYTVVMKPPFIRAAPAVLAFHGSKDFSLARRTESFDEVFSSYVF